VGEGKSEVIVLRVFVSGLMFLAHCTSSPRLDRQPITLFSLSSPRSLFASSFLFCRNMRIN
jgi:hypothetical protein